MEERTGRLAEDLLRQAIDVLHARQPGPQPWPRSIGIVSDGGVNSSNLDEWLAENRMEHLEQEMGGSSDGDDDDRSSG